MADTLMNPVWLPISLLFFFSLALLIPFLGRKGWQIARLLPVPASALFFVVAVVAFMQRVNTGQGGLLFSWMSEPEVTFSLYPDSLSLFFYMLISGIGTLIFWYSDSYFFAVPGKRKHMAFMLFFMASMLGLVVSGNLILLFVFWELTSLASFFLIGFDHENEDARKAAHRSLIITTLGGLTMLGGFVLLGEAAGSYDIAVILGNGIQIQSHPHYIPILLLVLAGVFTKSAQFPFHFWLPGAMKAPATVSAFLHSATMVKAGVFLLLRLNPVLGNTLLWQYILVITGTLTMLTGAFLALCHSDMKKILAYTTISALGIHVFLIGIDTSLSVNAALIFLLVHATYKAVLFMVMGFMEKLYGTRELEEVSGIFRVMPWLGVATLLSLAAMAGLPPMLGFISKEMMVEAKLQAPGIFSYSLVAGIATNLMIAAVSLLLAWKLLFRKPVSPLPVLHRIEPGYFYPPLILTGIGLLSGILPDFFGDYFIEPILETVRAVFVDVQLKLWHGFNQVLLISVLTVLAGTLLVISMDRIRPVFISINKTLFQVDLAKLYDNLVKMFVRFSEKNTGIIQHGYLRLYLITILLVTAGMVYFQLFAIPWYTGPRAFEPISPFLLALVAVMALSAVAVVFIRSRLAAIVVLGVTGYGIAMIYLYFGAADLAITQIIAETLLMVIFVMVVLKLPKFTVFSRPAARIRDGIIGLLAGGAITGLMIKATSISYGEGISSFFTANSLSQAYGRNVVNVILVDFRALDTLGEMVVLVVAALGVFGLLYSLRKQ